MLNLKKVLKLQISNKVLPVITTTILLLIWEVVVRVFLIPQFVLPAPSRILSTLVSEGEVVFKNAIQTLLTTSVGFLLAIAAGVVLGFIIGYFKIAYSILYPLLVGFNTVPKVALVPLFAIWFGIGAAPAILTAFLLAFFPITANVAAGLNTVEKEMQDVLKSLGASKLETFQKVGLPHSLPYLFASLKVAISFAFVGSVISETVASNGGVGYLILSASSNFDVPLAFSGLLILAVMGTALYSLFILIEQRLMPWTR